MPLSIYIYIFLFAHHLPKTWFIFFSRAHAFFFWCFACRVWIINDKNLNQCSDQFEIAIMVHLVHAVTKFYDTNFRWNQTNAINMFQTENEMKEQISRTHNFGICKIICRDFSSDWISGVAVNLNWCTQWNFLL